MHAWERVMAKRKQSKAPGVYINGTSLGQKTDRGIDSKDANHIGCEFVKEERLKPSEPKIPRKEGHFSADTYPDKMDQLNTLTHTSKEVNCNGQSEIVCDNDYGTVTREFSSIYTALQWATQGRELSMDTEIDLEEEIPSKLKNVDHIQVLVTGSLHLVGGVLGVVGMASD